MNKPLTRLLAGCVLALSLGPACAADFSSAPSDPLATARARIDAGRWTEAIAELKRVNDTGSADWNNLMGYSLRKAQVADLAGSEKYYDEALRIDPRHRGALAYSGELYLTKGDLAAAEKRLAALDRLCNSSCAERTALKKSIDSYKANGSRSAGHGGY